jgi:hypothetical protein
MTLDVESYEVPLVWQNPLRPKYGYSYNCNDVVHRDTGFSDFVHRPDFS